VTSATALGTGGALFLHFGLLKTTLLGIGSIIGGMGGSMLPLPMPLS